MHVRPGQERIEDMNVRGFLPLTPGDRSPCPDCRTPAEPDFRICAQCGLLLHGPEAQSLSRIDSQVAELRSRTQALRTERDAALEDLRRASRVAAAAAVAPSPPAQAEPWAPEPATPAS